MSYQWLEKALKTIHQANWYRSVTAITSLPGSTIEIDGNTFINFASNDYLGLAGDPRLIKAAVEATQQFGTGSTGSRLLSGHRELHQELETAIASLKQTEEALVFSSGYLANLGTITAIVGTRDLILGDQYNHSSLKNGSKLSSATVLEYDHCNSEDLQEKLQQHRHQYRRCLIITDSIFSMDGNACPLQKLLSLAADFDCMLLVDEAHATGVIGETGAGLVEHFGCSNQPLIMTGTLSKALGSLGGYVAGSRMLIDFLRNRAPTWIYTTGLSPADTSAALEAIKIMQNEPQRRKKLWDNVNYLKEKLCDFNLFTSDSPILCLGIETVEKALTLASQLKEKGIFVPAIRPPTVPTSRLRFSVMATHEETQLQQLVTTLNQLI
ncbi:8-amino-7-oxononanoate synthase [Rippkaea orientalis PCC 8801]|uniref:Putative 8-amino-7-oxononanoate synthase n=1 Tax=Rippkaea orientalis (strain PCC 8801 / RF-1) TaxID=41431 RepID=BIOF_RIPO1|nr:8-amino-7-oxononanoate synthase [Rippkaea orientalis]B7K0L9.1 RecName: Full=Putative 8-amino-7-oxononanoate synthase; Short=AONS; AltName: Full=7-keto-8-amino-pelargonic acid synthase; Short=7-KAP synthase; AltName: Full=8-amino-7-ketopelargonate synthase [Rippkaea orientalis PCC 8801]ACK64173.1 8-amino-7-oxononanoate synthase [Rippkaea orientalis PCC 8801]